MAGDDVAGSLIDALAGEGEHVDDGGFTLDAAAARAKLRQHQLTDPHEYLLVLVEAAWVANDGQGTVDIEVGSTTAAEFAGVTIEAEALRELFAAVLSGFGELDGEALRSARVLQLLGIAANAALALEPAEITIDARDRAGQTHRVRIATDGSLTVAPSELTGQATVRFALRGGGFELRRNSSEHRLVEERCRHSGLHVFVDGVRVSVGTGGDMLWGNDAVSGKPLRGEVEFEGQKVGWVGWSSRDLEAPPATWIVNRGVAVRDPDLSDRPGSLNVVEVDLPMDLSRKQLLRGPRLDALREAIREARPQLGEALQARIQQEGTRTMRQVNVAVAVAVVTLVVVVGLIAINSERSKPDDLSTMMDLEGTNPAQPQPQLSLAQVQAELEAQCRSGMSSTCALAGDLTLDPAKELELLTLGCAGLDARSCERLVERQRDATMLGQDREALREALVRACLGAGGEACLGAAWFHEHGFVDPEAEFAEIAAADLLERGCSSGVERACELRSRPTVAERCEAGEALACYAFGLAGRQLDPERDAEFQALCQAEDEPVDQDRCAALEQRRFTLGEGALVALDTACAGKLAEACHAAGVARLWGLGGREELERAGEDLEIACRRQLDGACEAERTVAELSGQKPKQRRPLGAGDPKFPRPIAPRLVEPWAL